MKAWKANKIISIPESQKEQYLQAGWAILDDQEKIIAKPLTGEAELKSQIEALKIINANKDKEIQSLQAEVARLVQEQSAANAEGPADEEAKAKGKK